TSAGATRVATLASSRRRSARKSAVSQAGNAPSDAAAAPGPRGARRKSTGRGVSSTTTGCFRAASPDRNAYRPTHGLGWQRRMAEIPMSGVKGGRRRRTTAWNEAPTQSRKRSATATPQAYGTAPALDPSPSLRLDDRDASLDRRRARGRSLDDAHARAVAHEAPARRRGGHSSNSDTSRAHGRRPASPRRRRRVPAQ